MLFLDCMNMCWSFWLLICYICTCSSRFIALFLSKMIISPYIYSKYTWFLLKFERVFVEHAKRYEISDFRSWLYVSLRVFDINFGILPPRFQSPTKVRHSVTPKCQKLNQIWLHQSMRREKLCVCIQGRLMKLMLYLSLRSYVAMRKPHFYQRDYIYTYI